MLVVARVPETERPARHRLRTRLAWAGLGSPSPGVWLSPHPDRLDEVREVLGEAGVLDDAQMFVASYVGGAELTAVVRQAWDLASIEVVVRAVPRPVRLTRPSTTRWSPWSI